MLVNSEDGRKLINDVGYRDHYFANPEQYGQQTANADEALSFGITEAIETFTYSVLPLATPVLGYLVGVAHEALKDEAGGQAINWVRRLFKQEEKTQPLFSQDELATIAKEIDVIVAKEARRLGVKKSQAKAMRDAIISRLSLSTTS